MAPGPEATLHQPQISTNYVRILLDYLQRREAIDADQFVRNLGLDPSAVARADDMLPMATFLMLIEEAAEHVGDPVLGLHYYADLDFRELGIFGYAALNAGSLGETFALASRYYCLFQSDMELDITVDQGMAKLSYRITAGNLPYSRQDSEMTIAGIIALARVFLGADWQPESVGFQHPAPADISEHQRLLCRHLQFGQPTNTIRLDAALLETPPPRGDTQLSRTLQATLDQLLALSQLPSDNDWLNELQQQIIESLSDGPPGVEDIAAQLHISGRTLQRKLLKEGLGFKDLVESVRYQLACNYLGASNLSIQDIAFLLGYSELSSFNRAFKRWTDHAPAEYRKRHRIADPSANQES